MGVFCKRQLRQMKWIIKEIGELILRQWTQEDVLGEQIYKHFGPYHVQLVSHSIWDSANTTVAFIPICKSAFRI